MKIIFDIYNETIFETGSLSVQIDWDCPYIPRIGDIISYSILKKGLNPDTFYNSLKEESKIEWQEDVLENRKYFTKEKEEKSRKMTFRDWIEDMFLQISNIEWKYSEEWGYFLRVMI